MNILCGPLLFQHSSTTMSHCWYRLCSFSRRRTTGRHRETDREHSVAITKFHASKPWKAFTHTRAHTRPHAHAHAHAHTHTHTLSHTDTRTHAHTTQTRARTHRHAHRRAHTHTDTHFLPRGFEVSRAVLVRCFLNRSFARASPLMSQGTYNFAMTLKPEIS
jgi:hypothetical protein